MKHKTFILSVPKEKDSIQFSFPVTPGSAHPSKIKEGYTDFYFENSSKRNSCFQTCRERAIPFLTRDSFLDDNL